MPIDLRDVELILAVVDSGSITDGARNVGLSLSTASARITALERAFSVRLFDRGRGGAAPTATGLVFTDHARRLMSEASDLTDVLIRHRDSAAERIRLATNTSATDLLTEFLASALSRFPSLRVDVEEASSVEVARRVRTGAADLGVVSVLPSSAGLAVRRLWADPLVIVHGPRTDHGLRTDHGPRRSDESVTVVGIDGALTFDEALTFDDAIRGPMIGLSAGNPLQEFIDEKAHLLGVRPNYRVRLPTPDAVHAVASTGAGCAVLPRGTTSRLGASAATITPIAEDWALRQANLLTPDGAEQTETIRDFADAMLRFGDEAV